jgi:hypothetical protein
MIILEEAIVDAIAAGTEVQRCAGSEPEINVSLLQ